MSKQPTKSLPTVGHFLIILQGHLVQYDQKQSTKVRGWNPYALAHYMRALNNVCDATEPHHGSSSNRAMAALKTALSTQFCSLRPVDQVTRKIDAWINNGKIPKYPISKIGR